MYLMFLHVDHGSGEAISAIAKWKVEGTIDDIYGFCIGLKANARF